MIEFQIQDQTKQKEYGDRRWYSNRKQEFINPVDAMKEMDRLAKVYPQSRWRVIRVEVIAESDPIPERLKFTKPE